MRSWFLSKQKAHGSVGCTACTIEWDAMANRGANDAILIEIEGLRQLMTQYLITYDHALVGEFQFLT